MKHIYSIFFLFLGTIPLILAANFLFLKDPLVWPDEAIYLDTARTLATTGRLATNIFNEAIPGLSEHAFWYPPLYFYLLALWTNFIGPSIESVRFLSLMVGLLTLTVFFFTIKIIWEDNRWALLATFILATDFSFSRASRVGRMDMFSFFLLVSSILAFLVAQKEKSNLNKSIFFYLVTGILGGLGIITNPLGFIAPTVIILYLFIQKRPSKYKLLSTALVTLPTLFALFFWFFCMRDSFGLFIEQYRLQFLRKAQMGLFPVELWLSNHSWKIIFSLYGLSIFLLVWQIIKRKKSIDLFILLGITISTAVLTWGKEFWYILYFQPFITLILLSLLQTALYTKDSKLLLTMVGSISIILILNINMFLGMVKQLGTKSYDYHQFTKSINDNLLPKTSIFLATIPDPYFDLKQQKNKNFQLYEFPTVPISDKTYKKLLDSVDYLILNMMPDKRLENYMRKYAVDKTEIKQPSQFSTTIYKLINRKKRD